VRTDRSFGMASERTSTTLATLSPMRRFASIKNSEIVRSEYAILLNWRTLRDSGGSGAEAYAASKIF
jgi:hypothetical protein